MEGLKEILISGRLSAISSFTGDSPASLIRKYRKLFERYYDVRMVEDILEKTPRCKEITDMIQKAEELSLAEHDLEKKLIEDNSLRTVFSRITAGDSGAVIEKNKYGFKPLSLNSVFPLENTPPKADLNYLRNNFFAEMDSVQNNAPETEKAFRIVLDRILGKYTWCISSSMREEEDISLYDYMKVTEAILSGIVMEGESSDPEKRFAFVMADFSGIQKYIFQIATTNTSGVAKRLRARSFYVDIMVRVFAQYVVDRFEVGRANILLETGGKFYLLIPWRKDTEQKLLEIRTTLERFLFKKFEGTVSVNMAWLPAGDEGICNYSESITELNRRLTDEKAKPFSSVLKNGKGWNESSFIITNDLGGKKICPSCNASLIDKGQECCRSCAEQLEIGRRIPRAKFIVYRHEYKTGSFHVFENTYISLTEKAEFEGAFLVGAIKEINQDAWYYKYPVMQQYMVNHIPQEKGEILSFSDIADRSKGMKKLAVLKMDVDVLGYLFADGLRGKTRHFGTISRVNTMSRMMAMFFGGYVNTLLEKNNSQYGNVYSVFSGGDDLFLIGQWDLMPGLAIQIHDEFVRFTGANPAMTVSAAVSVFGKKSHVAYMAELSEDQLKKAKNEAPEKVYPGKGGRDGVCFAGDVYSWEDFRDQTQKAELLEKLIRYRKLSAGILRRLAEYGVMYREYVDDGKTEGLMAIPLLNYDYSRNYNLRFKDETEKNELGGIANYIHGMKSLTGRENEVQKDLYFAVNTVKHAMNLTREGR